MSNKHVQIHQQESYHQQITNSNIWFTHFLFSVLCLSTLHHMEEILYLVFVFQQYVLRLKIAAQ